MFGGAKELGVDVFLLDDGWFANKYPRNSDRAGLGDWETNKQKLPHGLGYLVEQAEAKGVKFGIWIEPEMVNPKLGYSYFFPSITSCNHITTMGKQSLKYRTDVAMMGKMGYDIRVNEMTAEELEFSKMALYVIVLYLSPNE